MSRARFSSSGAGWQAQAMSALRPGVEAVLLAGVALGCAQLGWQAIAPQVADASGSETTTMHVGPIMGDTRSPFAPFADANPAAHQTAAAVAGLKLAGVRMASDPSLSGAVLTLEGGHQRAFLVGQEVAAGVLLSSVDVNSVVLGFSGGETQLSLTAAPSTGALALALMGRAPSPSVALAQVQTPTAAETIAPVGLDASPLAAASAPFSSAPSSSAPVEAAPASTNQRQPDAQLIAVDHPVAQLGSTWIAATLAQPLTEAGAVQGWRVAFPLPDAVRAVGIREGDILVGVNGSAPGDLAQAMAAAKAGPLVVDVKRASGELVSVPVGLQSPS